MIDLERFWRGDKAYLGEIVKTYERLVLTVAESFAEDPDHGEDLYQEIWRRVLEKRRSYSGRGSFEVWLHRVATRVCINDARARRIRGRALERMEEEEWSGGGSWKEEGPLGEAERRELHPKLLFALARLPDRQHQAICLRVLDGATPREVSKIMGIKKATIRSLVRNGVIGLRNYLEVPRDE